MSNSAAAEMVTPPMTVDQAPPATQTPLKAKRRARNRRHNKPQLSATTVPPTDSEAEPLTSSPTAMQSGLHNIRAKRPYIIDTESYIDTDGARVPQRMAKVSRIYDVYCVRHNAPIDITEHPTVVVTAWDSRQAARNYFLHTLKTRDKVQNGRRDVYTLERGVSQIRTNAYKVGRRKDRKPHSQPTLDAARIPSARLQSFQEQVMRRMGLAEDEIASFLAAAPKQASAAAEDMQESSQSEAEEKIVSKPRKARAPVVHAPIVEEPEDVAKTSKDTDENS